MGLKEIQTKWVEKYVEMQEVDEQGLLAAPFFSVPFESDLAGKSGAILLVGKATAGPWHLKEFLARLRASSRPSQVADERRSVTREHLNFRKERDRRPSAFWTFWKALGKIGSPVIWTNLAKIGVIGGNPRGRYLDLQKELAQRTLRAEINEYRPSLVFLVSGEFAIKEIVSPVFEKSGEWEKPKDENYWWRNRTEEMPPVLWAYHPQGSYGHKEEWDKWIGQARRLLGRS